MRFLGFILILLLGCSSSSETESTSQSGASSNSHVPWFREVSVESGIEHVYYSDASAGKYYLIETIGGGAALFDYDKDGDLDLYLTQGNVLGGAKRDELVNRLFENHGDGNFTERTNESGLADDHYSIGVIAGDYNNDGFVDLYVTNFGSNTLYQNNGDGTFSDVTEFAGVGGTELSACAEFSDLDGDGDLDLFVTNYIEWTTADNRECLNERGIRTYCNPVSYTPLADTLYMNNGDGTFNDATQSSGISKLLGTGLGVAIAKVNKDNLPDIFVANDGLEDRLWINQGNGVFKNEALLYGCAVDDSGKEKGSMGVEFIDIDVDGDLDLLVTTLFHETDSFYINQGGTYVDATARWGLAADTRSYTRWGITFADFNNNGSLELYEATGRIRVQPDVWHQDDLLAEPNLLFEQSSSGRFSLVDPTGGVSTPLIHTSHGVAAGDMNNDGGIDLVIMNKDASVSVLRNVVEERGHWIMLDIRTAYDAPALGATAYISLQNGSTLMKDVRVARGYASASDPRVHVGLGTLTQVESVKVIWADGTERLFGSLQADAIHELRP